MELIHKTSVLAMLTLEENIRKKILYILLFVSVALVAFSSSMTSFNLGAQTTLIRDISLSGISLFGIIFTLSLFLNVIPHEIETKTIYPFLAQPISRGNYIVGKFLGLFLLIAGYLLFLGLELIVVLHIYEHTWDWTILQPIVLNILQCGILGAIMLLFSLVSSYPLALTITLFLYIIGGVSTPYLEYLGEKFPSWSMKLIVGIKLLLPKFDIFNIKDAIVHGTPLLHGYFVHAIFYGVVFILLVLLLAIMIFDHKDL